jgi:hypothetical protein
MFAAITVIITCGLCGFRMTLSIDICPCKRNRNVKKIQDEMKNLYMTVMMMNDFPKKNKCQIS